LRYDFIRQEKKACPVTVLCKVMEVSRSGLYEYFHSFNKRSDSPEEAALNARIGAGNHHLGCFITQIGEASMHAMITEND